MWSDLTFWDIVSIQFIKFQYGMVSRKISCLGDLRSLVPILLNLHYRALVMHHERLALEERATTSTSQIDSQLWNALWKLNVVPKIRVNW